MQPHKPSPAIDGPPQAQPRASWVNAFRNPTGVGVLFAFYILMLIVFSILSPFFFSTQNFLSISTNMAYIGLMAGTQTLLIIAGGLDMSVASVAGISGVVLTLLVKLGLNIWLAAGISLVLGGLIGYLNSISVTRIRINPLIATLGMLNIVEGLALVMTGGLTRPVSDAGFGFLGSGRVLGLPMPVILMVITFIALYWLLSTTRFGRFVYATGGNPDASRLAGVPVNGVLTRLFILSGVSGALAGLILVAMLGASAPTAASSNLLTVIASVILGGTSLAGGRGSVWGTLLAVLILGTLNNGLVLLNVSSFWQSVTQGVVLLLAVGLDQLRTRVLGD
jgi:ribose transport system permease protein